jgi:hypothetical protein
MFMYLSFNNYECISKILFVILLQTHSLITILSPYPYPSRTNPYYLNYIINAFYASIETTYHKVFFSFNKIIEFKMAVSHFCYIV